MMFRIGRNDACHCGSGKKYKRCHLDPDALAKRSAAEPVGAEGGGEGGGEGGNVTRLPDLRSMERPLAMLAGGMGGERRRQSGGLDTAQELMFQAWEERSAERRIALARKALEASPDCADAYVLLAEEAAAGSLEEMTRLYVQGVAAGERAIGKGAFEEHVGHFWGLLETRPYMRARHGLGQCLWQGGDRDGAIAHFLDLLRLNPNDNQGVRDHLAACFLEAGRDDELAELLSRYENDASAVWAYSRALLEFRLGGEGDASRGALEAAVKANPHVPAYLIGRKKLPRRLPDHIGLGDEPEAIAYAAEHVGAWKAASGALGWLRRAGAGK